MDKEQAIELSRELVDAATTVVATSDGSIFVDSNVEAVEAMAKENNLEVFYIKPFTQVEAEQAPTPKKKIKDGTK